MMELQYRLTQRFLANDAEMRNNVLTRVPFSIYPAGFFSGPAVFPVNFEDPPFVTLPSLLQCSFRFYVTAESEQIYLLPWLFLSADISSPVAFSF